MNGKRFAGNHPRLWGVMAVVACAVSAGLLVTHRMGLTADSMRYALVSQELLSSATLRWPVIPFDESLNAPDARGTVALLEQPPGFPIVLAALGSVRPDRMWPSRVVNVCCHVVIAVVSMLITSRLCDRTVGVLAGIIVAVASPLLSISHFVWSEGLFTALVMLSVWFLLLSRQSGSRTGHLLISGVFAAGAMATRFAGVALLPLFLWDGFVSCKRARLRTGVRHLLVSGAASALVAASLLTRNLVCSGTIRGMSQPRPEHAWDELLGGLTGMMGAQFGLRHLGTTLCLVALLGGVAIAAFVLMFADRKNTQRLLKAGFDMILAFAVSYTLVISYAMFSYQPRFEIRFMTPLLPFMVICVVIVADAVCRWLGHIADGRGARCGFIAFLLLIVLMQCYRSFSNRADFVSQNADARAFLDSQTYRWLAEHCTADSVVATNRPFLVPFFAGCSALRLPSRGWNSHTVIPEDMDARLPQRMSQVGARYLVLFAGPEGLDGRLCGETVSALSRREPICGQLVMIHDCVDGVVYECH